MEAIKTVNANNEVVWVAHDGREFQDEWECSLYISENYRIPLIEKVKKELEVPCTLSKSIKNNLFYNFISQHLYAVLDIKSEEDLDKFIEAFDYCICRKYIDEFVGVKADFTYPQKVIILADKLELDPDDDSDIDNGYTLHRISDIEAWFKDFIESLS